MFSIGLGFGVRRGVVGGERGGGRFRFGDYFGGCLVIRGNFES